MKILVINCGSSSLKYQLIDMETESVLAKGNYERIGETEAFLTHKVGEQKYTITKTALNHEIALQTILSELTNSEHGVIASLEDINSVGHRIVHGGEIFNKSVLITPKVIEQIEECAVLAPLHNPAAVLGIKACQSAMPNVKMVAVFDTAFHQTMPKSSYLYPIPYEYYEKHRVRKYGAHGTSHKFVSEICAKLMDKPIEELNIVTCHLGQGASLCAVKAGDCVDTSMGLSPLGGIAMVTRSGDLDPSVVTYIMKKENLSPDEMETILNKKSGIYGISKISPDNRDIEEAAAAGNEQAILTLKEYAYIIAQYIGKYAVTMNGVDVITFTAGVGERGPETREEICNYLGFMGVELDKELNKVKGEEREISTNNSKVKVWIVPTNEELMIARETMNLVK